jgi:hypothetical protein
MSRRPHISLFETTHSALQLPTKPVLTDPRPGAVNGGYNLSLDKSFWILRELGRHLAAPAATPPPVPPYRRDAGRLSA